MTARHGPAPPRVQTEPLPPAPVPMDHRASGPEPLHAGTSDARAVQAESAASDVAESQQKRLRDDVPGFGDVRPRTRKFPREEVSAQASRPPPEHVRLLLRQAAAGVQCGAHVHADGGPSPSDRPAIAAARDTGAAAPRRIAALRAARSLLRAVSGLEGGAEQLPPARRESAGAAAAAKAPGTTGPALSDGTTETDDA